MPYAISTTRSTLMHAALAHLSPELQTLDSLIRRPNTLCIPPEVLLIIRFHILPIVTVSLIAASTVAQHRYELSLRALLCPECLLYNEEIFGSDVWQWEQFSGPCACAEAIPGAQSQPILPVRTPKTTAITLHPPSSNPSPLPRPHSKINPKQFTHPEHWLEHHLSLQVIRLRRPRNIQIHQSRPFSSNAIWDAVSDVLREFGCEIIHGHSGALNYGRFMALGGNSISDRSSSRWNYINARILVSPSVAALRLFEQENIGERGKNGDRWRTHIILSQIERDLGLSHDEEICTHSQQHAAVFSSARASSSSSRKGCTSIHPILGDFPPSLLFLLQLVHWHTLTAVIAACITFPFAFLTVSLTLICCYCKPGAFRIM